MRRSPLILGVVAFAATAACLAGTLHISTAIKNVTDDWERRDLYTPATNTGTFLQHVKQNVDTSETEIAVSAAITGGNGPGWLYLQNHFTLTTNGAEWGSIQIGTATGAYSLRLDPGMSAVLPLSPAVTSLFCIATNATAQLEVLIYER